MVPDEWQYDTIVSAGINIIDGDRGTEYPKASDFQDKGYCVFLSAKNVSKTGFNFEEIQFISKGKHELLRKGVVKYGDVVLTTRGTVGQFAVYNKQLPFDAIRINSGMVVLRNTKETLDTNYFYTVCRSPVIQRQIDTFAFGSAQPQLTVGVIKKRVIVKCCVWPNQAATPS